MDKEDFQKMFFSSGFSFLFSCSEEIEREKERNGKGGGNVGMCKRQS